MLNKEKKVHVSTCPIHDVLDRHGHKQQMIVSVEKKKHEWDSNQCNNRKAKP